MAHQQPPMFVKASSGHLSQVAQDLQRIQRGGGVHRSNTHDAIVQEVMASVPIGKSGIGAGAASSSAGLALTSSSGPQKRFREDDDVHRLDPSKGGVASNVMEQCTVAQLLFPYPELEHAAAALRVASRPYAVAFVFPMKWAFVHVVVVPRLPERVCARAQDYPNGWEAFGQLDPAVRAPCLEDMARLRDDVVASLCESTVALAHHLTNERVLSVLGRSTGGGELRWTGAEELRVARSLLAKKRPDGSLMAPFRVGVFTTHNDPLLNAPALHILSCDGFYCRASAAMWHTMFTLFTDLAPRLTVREDVAAMEQCCQQLVGLSMAERIARRRQLLHCGAIKCPLCPKVFQGAEEVAQHWVTRCLPNVAAAVDANRPLFL